MTDRTAITTPPGFGLHTFGFVWEADAVATVERLIGHGVKTLQLMATPPHFDPWTPAPGTVRRLRRMLDAAGADLLALDLASSDVNLASAAPHVVEFAIDAYVTTIERCRELGARWICVGSGRRHALLPHVNDRLMESFAPAFARIVSAARGRGVGVILENHPQGLLADAATIDGFLATYGYDDVPVIYDVANAFAIGEDPVEGLVRLLPRLGIIHLSDAPRGQWRHDPIGTGDIDFAAIGRTVRDAGFKGPVVLEILSDRPLDDAVAGSRRLAELGWHLPSIGSC